MPSSRCLSPSRLRCFASAAERGMCGAFTIAEREARKPDVGDVYVSLFWQIPLFISSTQDGIIWAVDDAGVTDVCEWFRETAE